MDFYITFRILGIILPTDFHKLGSVNGRHMINDLEPARFHAMGEQETCSLWQNRDVQMYIQKKNIILLIGQARVVLISFDNLGDSTTSQRLLSKMNCFVAKGQIQQLRRTSLVSDFISALIPIFLTYLEHLLTRTKFI